jgi:uncharacterized FAD-dependent dehydrogenase
MHLKELPTECDVLIVGAGPAGLFAALGILLTSDSKVTLIDAGSPVEDRKRASGNGSQDLVSGFGGAGLFSDGKLCLSLEVGGYLRGSLSSGKKRALLEMIKCFFCGLLNDERVSTVDAEEVAQIAARASELGLDFKYYPVLHIGSERCREVIVGVTELLDGLGAYLVSRSRLRALRQSGDYKVAEIEHDGEAIPVLARRTILAMGKMGAPEQAAICASLSIPRFPSPMYAGVRLETNSRHLQSFFRVAKDPKYSLRFTDGSKIKTHCASEGGEVLALNYSGLPLAGGHNFYDRSTGRGGFSLLWDGIRFSGDAYGAAKRLMAAIAAYTGGGLLVQRLQDFQAGVASRDEDITSLPLTSRKCRAGDIRAFLPGEYCRHLEAFLDKLALLEPALFSEEAVLYAPAIEWWMNRIEVINENLETSVRGLYVCGDGSGWSQGIVHSAATGLLAAEGVTGKLPDPKRLEEVAQGQAARQAW